MTRTEPGASRTATRLAARGFEPLIAPVLAVRPIIQPVPDLTGIAALAFTSPNGVAVFADLTPARDLPVFVVGDATAERARQAGFADVTSASGALSDLAWLIAGAAPGRLLIPGAREPAGDINALLNGAVETVILPVYEATETKAKPPADFEAVLAHSPRAAGAVARVLGRTGGAGRLAVAISAAAAAPLAAAGFAEIRTAGEPTDAAVLLALGNPAARV
ncbi:uroporphyrinogen-III synthase [Brevundimonas sp.]|uniref:uroporphyrinogen-III synthase n=1 Tax=Brevundimonas sp. TaxID=1871086 RepID=UPI003F6F15EB